MMPRRKDDTPILAVDRRPSRLVLVSDGRNGAHRREFDDATLLDRLLRSFALGGRERGPSGDVRPDRLARQRRDTGIALRELHDRTGYRSEIVGAYGVPGAKFEPDAVPTPDEAKARAHYAQVLWQLPGANEVVQVCIWDEMPRRMGFLINGLDALRERL